MYNNTICAAASVLQSLCLALTSDLCPEMPTWSDDIIDCYETSCSQLICLLLQKYFQWLVQLRTEALSFGSVCVEALGDCGNQPQTQRAVYPADQTLRRCGNILSCWNSSVDQLFLFMVVSFMGFSFSKIIRSFSRSVYKKPTGSVFLKECDWGLFFLFCYLSLTLKFFPSNFSLLSHPYSSLLYSSLKFILY